MGTHMDFSKASKILVTNRWNDEGIRAWLADGDDRSELRTVALTHRGEPLEVVGYDLSRVGAPVHVLYLPSEKRAGVRTGRDETTWVPAKGPEDALRKVLPVLPPNTYDIPADLMGQFDAKLEKLNRKAVKLGVPRVSYEVLGEEAREVRRNGEIVPFASRQWAYVQVTGGAVGLEGWRFLATLDFSDPAVAAGQFALRLAPGVTTLPARWRTSDNDPHSCDHCNKRRRRAKTFVVQHEDGTALQVGASCLSDFLGGRNAQSIASWFSALAAFDRDMATAEDEDEGSWGGSSIPVTFSLEEFVGMCATVIRTRGYVSGREAREQGGQPTGAFVMNVLFPFGKEWHRLAAELRAARTEGDDALAAEALAWLPSMWEGQSDEELTDYVRNMKAYTSAGLVSGNSQGYAASIIPAYRRWQEKDVERKHAQKIAETSRHQGSAGERTEWTATVSALREIEGQYGVKTMVKLTTDDGSVLVWWASGAPRVIRPQSEGVSYRELDLDIGMRVNVRGTVKKHGEYRGVQETTLSRCILSVAE